MLHSKPLSDAGAVSNWRTCAVSSGLDFRRSIHREIGSRHGWDERSTVWSAIGSPARISIPKTSRRMIRRWVVCGGSSLIGLRISARAARSSNKKSHSQLRQLS